MDELILKEIMEVDINEESESMTKTLGSRRPVTVTVRIISDDPPQFAFESHDVPIKKVKHKPDGGEDQMLTFDNYQTGTYQDGFAITFEIDDKTKKKYGFFVDDPVSPGPSNALSAKCVDSAGHCPAPGDRWNGFAPTEVHSDRQKLVVENANDQLQYFGFALHFSLDGETSASLTCDPIGDNQNGTLIAQFK
jgi:hypothetical protein